MLFSGDLDLFLWPEPLDTVLGTLISGWGCWLTVISGWRFWPLNPGIWSWYPMSRWWSRHPISERPILVSWSRALFGNKGNNKLTELRTILQRKDIPFVYSKLWLLLPLTGDGDIDGNLYVLVFFVLALTWFLDELGVDDSLIDEFLLDGWENFLRGEHDGDDFLLDEDCWDDFLLCEHDWGDRLPDEHCWDDFLRGEHGEDDFLPDEHGWDDFLRDEHGADDFLPDAVDFLLEIGVVNLDLDVSEYLLSKNNIK